jgi:hypothetical protein
MRAAVLLALILAVVGTTCLTALAEDLTVKLVKITSPIGLGEEQTLVVQTEPGATCHAQPVAGNVKVNFSTHTANANGRVRWSWTVRGASHSVKHGIEVVCTLGDRKGKLVAEFTVQ